MHKNITSTLTNASAGLQDANPTIWPYATPPPPIPTAPLSHGTQFQLPTEPRRELPLGSSALHPGSNAAAVTPRKPKFTKAGEAHRG